ncbi:splicing factor, CC1-like protein [Auricularia subglabra TFB-10046 SS5]|nr:splicing factor, CC1-like protein [Auricularia subglabra TFB-10046 SS5]
MSSPSGKSLVDRIERTPDHKSSRAESVGSPHTRRSHRSRSRSRDRRDRHRDSKRDPVERRSERGGRDRRSRSRDRSHRDRSDRDRERDKDKDKDKDRERRREREPRDSESRHRERDRDNDRERDDERRDRRRKREDEEEGSPETKEREDRSKRKRDDTEKTPSQHNGSVDGGRHSSDRRPRSRDSDRRRDDRSRRDDRDRRDRYDNRDRRGGSGGPPGRPARPPSPPRREPSTYELAAEPEPEEDSEARSVFVSQLAARLTARDLGYFFEDKLGEGAVRDARIVTDRISRRSKGIGYVELRSIDLVTKALDLSGTIVMGLPIMVQLTEAERNRVHAGENLNLPPGVSAPQGGAMQLYVGSLHFNLTEQDIKQVFEPFGELDFVDLHRDPGTGRSKGYAFVQYKRAEDAKMALEQMDGFELAGRTLRVNSVNEKGVAVRNTTTIDSLEDSGGGNLNAASRQALMQKLARIDPPKSSQPEARKHIPQNQSTRSVLLLNMFDPDEETEPDWDKDLADDVKGECASKYGPVTALKIEKDSQGEIYVQFESVDSAKKAVDSLNGRWFGGRQVNARFISDAIMQAHR